VDISDAGIMAAAVVLAGAINKMASHMLAARKKRNGGPKPPDPALAVLTEIARDQLSEMRDVAKGISSMRSDLRMAALEQSHLQKSVEALHGRLDKVG